MKRFCFLLVLFSVVISCQKDYDRIKSPYKFLPPETNSVFAVNELNDFVKSIKNHNILSSIYIKELTNAYSVLENLNTTRQIYIAFLGENNSDYLILTENDSTLFIVDSIPNHISENLNDLKVNKTQIDSTVFYHKSLSNVFAVSNNLEILKNLNYNQENNKLTTLIETSDSKSIASLVFKSNSSNYSRLLFS